MEMRAADCYVVAAGTLQVAGGCIVAAVGMQPNTALAEEAGLLVQGGIVVDLHCRTSVPDIYAFRRRSIRHGSRRRPA